jgi:hypothetical protein
MLNELSQSLRRSASAVPIQFALPVRQLWRDLIHLVQIKQRRPLTCAIARGANDEKAQTPVVCQPAQRDHHR